MFHHKTVLHTYRFNGIKVIVIDVHNFYPLPIFHSELQARSVRCVESALVTWPAIMVHVNFAMTSLNLVVRGRRRNHASVGSASIYMMVKEIQSKSLLHKANC